MSDDDSDEEMTADEYARRQYERQQFSDRTQELLEGSIGAGSQIIIYEPTISWIRIERVLGAIAIAIPILGFFAMGLENLLSITIPQLWPISASIGIVTLGDYVWHRKYGSIPEPPEHPLQNFGREK